MSSMSSNSALHLYETQHFFFTMHLVAPVLWCLGSYGAGMEMLEILKNYLYSREWQEYIESFIHANCWKFKDSNSEEFTHEQYAIWKNFQEIAEQILEAALSEVNGTEFGTGLEVLEKELDRISLLPVKGPRDAHMKEVLGQLLTFDCYQTFALMMSQAAQEMYPDEDVEEHEEEQQSESKWKDEKSFRMESKHESPKYLNDLTAMGFPEDLARAVLENCPDEPLHALVALLSDMQEGNSGGDMGNGMGKSVNSSVEDNEEFDENEIEDVENEEHIETFCKNESLDYNDVSTKRALAFSVADAVKSGSLVRDNLELFKWACGVIDFDNELQSCYLFHRLSKTPSDSISFRAWPINGKFGKTNLVDMYYELERMRKESSDRGELGNMYSEKELQRMMELKRIAAMGTTDEQLMHTLITRHEEIAEDLKSHYRSCELLCSGKGVDTGIEREQLEEMYLFLKENVMSGETIDVVSDKVYRYMHQLDPSGKNTSAVNVLLDMHLLEDEQIVIKTRINALLRDPSSHVEDIDTEVLTHGPLVSSRAEFKDTPTIRPGIKEAFQSEKYHTPVAVSADRVKEVKGSSSMDQLKERLKEEHRKGLNKLKTSLQSVRAMKIGTYQKQGRVEDDNDELEQLKSGLDQQEKGIISGYKQRCIAETRALKKKFTDGVDDPSLTDDEKSLAAQLAAKSLRDKFELESKKLLEDQQYSRNKRKEQMMERLRRRQAAKGETDVVDEELEEEADKLIQLEDEKEYVSILRPYLVSMVASKVFDPSHLSGALSEDGSHSPDMNAISTWINETVNTSANYQAVGDHLLRTLLKDMDPSESDEVVSKTIGDLLSQAYLAEIAVQSSPNNSSLDLSEHYERIKRNILKEYKKMKEESDNALDYNQQRAHDNLKQRLNKKSSQGGLTLSKLTDTLNSLEKLPDINRNTDRWLDEQIKASYQEESSYLLSQHTKHHTQLVDNLEAQMNERRNKLQQRLKAIKEAKAADASNTKDGSTLQQQEDEEIHRLEQLQQRYDEFMRFVQSSDPKDLEKIGINELLRQMDRPSRGVKLSDRELFGAMTPIPTTISSPAALPPIEDFTVDSDAIRYAAKAAADLKRATYNEYKESIEEEAKKISSAYREVQQKHDIAMRLEQARQSQNLQRKLLQKKKNGV